MTQKATDPDDCQLRSQGARYDVQEISEGEPHSLSHVAKRLFQKVRNAAKDFKFRSRSAIM